MSDLVTATGSGLSLDELADELRNACADFSAAAEITLKAAVRIGELLGEARERIESGNWITWLEENFPFSVSTAGVWIRLAEYQELVAEADSPYKAAQLLRGQGLPPSRKWGSWSSHPEWIRQEAVRRVDEGEAQYVVADRLGVSRATISRWVNPDRAKRLDRQKKRRRRVAALRKEQEKEKARQKAASEHGGGIARAYSTLRQHLQALDVAIVEATDKDAQRALRLARNAVHQAEDKIAEALGVS